MAKPTTVVFQLADGGARVPKRATPGSAGYDLCSCVQEVIPPRTRRLVDSGVRVVIKGDDDGTPPDVYARIAPRSGLACRGIDVLAGVCDSDYRGTYRVLLANNSDEEFVVRPGDRIAQIVFEAIVHPSGVRVADPDEDLSTLDDAAAAIRGTGGFGSTSVPAL